MGQGSYTSNDFANTGRRFGKYRRYIFQDLDRFEDEFEDIKNMDLRIMHRYGIKNKNRLGYRGPFHHHLGMFGQGGHFGVQNFEVFFDPNKVLSVPETLYMLHHYLHVEEKLFLAKQNGVHIGTICRTTIDCRLKIFFQKSLEKIYFLLAYKTSHIPTFYLNH